MLTWCILTTVQAQMYNTGIGVRIGVDNGISLKHFVSDKNAVEGIVTFYKGINATALYEWQREHDFDVKGLAWYYGVGGHVGFWNKNKSPFNEEGSGTKAVIGLDGVIGLEYLFENAPITVGLDVRPIVNLIGDDGLWFQAGINVRYVFN